MKKIKGQGENKFFVYKIVKDLTTIYIGQTNNLKRRAIQHKKKFGVVELEVISNYTTRAEALIAESVAIQIHNPLYNKMACPQKTKSKNIIFRVKEKEFYGIKEICKKYNLTLSQFFREAANNYIKVLKNK